MSIKEKFLNKSNSYVFYKKQHHILLEKLNRCETKVSNLQSELKDKNETIISLKTSVYESNKEVNEYKKLIYELPKDLGRKLIYKKTFKKELNLNNPHDFNEKINWLMVYKYGQKEAKLTDKNLVKEEVYKKNIDYLNIPKTYKIYHNAEDIDLNELPDKFVLKCNHYSGSVFICTDKNNFDLNYARTMLNGQLKKNYGEFLIEYHYSLIKPCIIAEEYLDDTEHVRPIDYKFYCFNGNVENILVCSNRENELKLDDYDLEWNLRNYTLNEFKSEKLIKKPKNLDKMIQIAKKLSLGHTFVRVDLYEINNQIYFGELTFTPGAGLINYYRQEALNILGNQLELSEE